MKQRILVAVVGVPALIGILCFAPDWATAALMALLCVIGCHEFMGAAAPESARHWWGLGAALAVFTVFTVYFSAPQYETTPMHTLMVWLLAALIVLTFIAMVLAYGKDDALSFPDLSALLVSGVAIPLALGCLVRLRMLEYGAGLVLIPMVAAFMSDTMALFGGMLLGRTKLAPRVSPKKTREGAVSGLVGGMVGMVLYRIVFFLCTTVQLHLGWCVLLGLVGAVMGQLGDLSFSCVKRQCGIKDYGRLLPGHGGVLDRFDSVIFAAPVVWLLVSTVTLY